MLSQPAANEFREKWLPNCTDEGLEHLLGLLDRHSPQLLRKRFSAGSFFWEADQAPEPESYGCLATQIAKFHPDTFWCQQDAGPRWLHDVAGIVNSNLISDWDSGCKVEAQLAYMVRQEQKKRSCTASQ